MLEIVQLKIKCFISVICYINRVDNRAYIERIEN